MKHLAKRWLPRVLILMAVAWLVASFVFHTGPFSPRPGWKLSPPDPGASPVSVTSMKKGVYPVASAIRDWSALGGFGQCGNYPHSLVPGREWGEVGKVSLLAFPDEPVETLRLGRPRGDRGFAVRVVNRSQNIATFHACDSLLPLVQEAKNEKGEWRPIESYPTSGCGNSFHRVMLKSGQYWQVPAQEYAGPFKTTLRFRLEKLDGTFMTSNEFAGAIDPTQFEAENDRFDSRGASE